MKRRPKTIATTGGNGGQGSSSGDTAFDWHQAQQLSDQVMLLSSDIKSCKNFSEKYPDKDLYIV